MSQLASLLQPLKIKDVTFRNRVLCGALPLTTAVGGLPKERYQLTHLERIRGGAALTVCGPAAAAVDSIESAGRELDAARDDIVPHFQRFAQRLHKEGGAVVCQITHKGAASHWDREPWLPALSASPLGDSPRPALAKAMEDHDISRVQLAFAWAMRRCRDGELDGCEVAFGQSLPMQFLSPLNNGRGDAYGGALIDRLRFARELLEKGRKMVGGDFLIGVQFSAEAFEAAGLEAEALPQVAAILAQDGHIDYFSVAAHEPLSAQALRPGDDGAETAGDLEVAGAVKRETTLPVFCGGNFRDLEAADRAVHSGNCDMVVMTRAHLADPHILRKHRTDADDGGRPCVGAGLCLDRGLQGRETLCLHNPASGREALLSHTIAKGKGPARKVVVVGAGPAGLEAARVSAARGHAVVLFERKAETGGQVRLAARSQAHLGGVVDWLEARVRAAGVDLRLETAASVAALEQEEPDIIVVATGGTAFRRAISGGEFATSSWDVLSGEVAAAASVLICDETGAQQALSCAAHVAAQGRLVELACRAGGAGAGLGPANRSAQLHRLYSHDVVLSPNLALREIYAEGERLVAVLRNEITLAEEERLVDQIVTECGTLPNDTLYFDLKPHASNFGATDLDALASGAPQRIEANRGGWFQLFRIGDAAAGRDIHAALYDAQRLCRVF